MADPNNYSQFFAKLKAVCRNVEQGISQLQNDVEKKSSSRSSGKAVMKLRNLKQEIQDMKADGRQHCQKLTEDNEKFTELMSCCRSLIDIQSHKLLNIEIFMKQYGYKDYKPKNKEEKKDDMEEEAVEETDDMKENQQPTTPTQEDGKPKKVKTPKPEDFGFSKFTLRAMERGFHTIQQDLNNGAIPHSEARIPSVFNDESVLMTPSVFGRHVPFYTPGNHQDSTPSYHDIFTPSDKKALKQAQMYDGSDIPKLNLADDNTSSPVPPVFQTPGMKHLGQKENFEKPPSGPVMALNSIQKAPLNSPQVPVFQSESMKKLMTKGDNSDIGEKKSRARLYDDLPQTPEFTCNLKNLHGISTLAKEPPISQPELLTQSKEPSPPTFQYMSKEITDIGFTKDFQPLSERLGHDITSNVTPPMPEMLTDRQSKFSTTSGSKQTTTDLSKTPPTPKFLSKYANDLLHNKFS